MSTATAVDERVSKASPLTRIMRRPEIGALMGALVVYIFFSVADQTGTFFSLDGTARWTDVASTYGIISIAVALLMIGGEFDLSSGVMIGSSGLFAGLLMTEYNIGVWPSIFLTFLFAAAIGFTNGWLVVTTGLPSFIVTLAMFFSLRGINLGVTKLLTDTVRVAGIAELPDGSPRPGYESAKAVFASDFSAYSFRIAVVWWLALTVVATLVLTRTRFGNWIFAVGGDSNAARNVGVPVRRTKIMLFMYVSMSSCLVGIISLMRLKSMQAGQGVTQEFIFIIAAVVGGCLLTGGYGSAIGGTIGAAIIGMAFIGIAYAQWNTDWTWLFLGLILFVAVLTNSLIRRRFQGARK